MEWPNGRIGSRSDLTNLIRDNAPSILWHFNLLGEFELAHAGPYVPKAELKRHVERATSRMRDEWVGAHDALLQEESYAQREYIGIPWLPTAEAVQALRAAGVPCIESPPAGVLHEVCDRAFLRELGGGLPASKHAVHSDDALRTLSEPSHQGWLVKRSFGMAGRGQRRIHSGRPTDADRTWLEASLRLGGVRIEPVVSIEQEWSVHGVIDATGAVRTGEPLAQVVSARGVWLGPARSDQIAHRLSPAWRAELERAATSAGCVLARAGYFGPFGIDAYCYRTHDGALRFQSLAELNARFTMSWCTAMGHVSNWIRCTKDPGMAGSGSKLRAEWSH